MDELGDNDCECDEAGTDYADDAVINKDSCHSLFPGKHQAFNENCVSAVRSCCDAAD